MPAEPDIGWGGTVALGAFSANVLSFDGPDMSATDIKTTHLGTATQDHTYIQGFREGGNITGQCQFDPDHSDPRTIAQGTVTVTYPIPAGKTTGATYTFSGYFNGWKPSVPDADELMTVDFSIKVSGPITITPSA